ncbi:hypothetical protein T484DRAFT_1602958, partial [Baffinella frigidus]
CEAGRFRTATGSCTACPSHTISAEGSDAVTDCVCVVGYTAAWDGAACSACNTGRYKAVTGAGECLTCPAGTSSASGSVEVTDCKCLAGYNGTSDGSVCAACESGTCKSVAGMGACSTCPTNSES